MTTPTPFIPAKRRVRRKRRSVSTPAPLPGAPVLVAAEYLAPGTWLRLTFDRPVSGPLVGEAIFVDDGPETGLVWVATAETPAGPTTLELTLSQVGTSGGAVTTLTAGAETGIVSTFDGTAWAGVTELPLPFG